ncbi:LysE/ArgO family amino acid transporter [Roseateles koreensis]|uniref:LysE/ArgO family amino acid transporter n=1 Tax=Roseateles koreensis TaxID=2987526 RepID=A0ABT5KPH8_9BURK|nr:LysE/ArgO family amino acid transporter [Roseateles koreensis]MDC8784809.1 LysE/ArgO family amino acid transporter [Roseateles koreensis]
MFASPSAVALSQGWLTGASLIMAIGAQNALVLRQGLMRHHVLPVVVLCSLADVVLIVLGVFGLGTLIVSQPVLMQVFRWSGALFLLTYGLRAAQRAWAGCSALQAAGVAQSLQATLTSAAAMTFLNPHVYLDTVVLLGTVGAAHFQAGADGRAAFALGASVASVMWFSFLGFGAAAAAPALQRVWVWRFIDAFVAALMWFLGVQLLWAPLRA